MSIPFDSADLSSILAVVICCLFGAIMVCACICWHGMGWVLDDVVLLASLIGHGLILI